MDAVKKIGKALMYLLGTIIPNLTFLMIFITFMVTIVSRYVLKAPVPWAYEISILAYMWTMFFGVGKAMANDEHVVFGLVYDHVGPRTKIIFELLNSLILGGLLMAVFLPSVQSLLAKRMVTGVLKLPYTLVFSPLIYMFAEMLVRSVLSCRQHLKNLSQEMKKAEGDS
ncbi:MAG: TRAP transporter small permease [Spirochaetales bacterium]|nr:TRAP transporter small permease [Spirochaetales bacterium]